MRMLPQNLAGAVLALLCTLPVVACERPAASGGEAMKAAPESGAFIVTLGADTVAVESFTRTEDRLEGRVVARSPRTTIVDYAADLEPDGAMARFEASYRTPADSVVSRRVEIEFGTDTAVVRLTRAGNTEAVAVPAPRGSVPSLGYSIAVYAPMVASAVAAGADSVDAGLILPGSPSPAVFRIRRLGGDSVIVETLAGANRVAVDAAGRVTGWNGAGTTIQVQGERVDALDLEAIAAGFAARDEAGQAMGALSPPDSVRASVAGADVAIDYSRPARRGRTIFGGIVPWDQVWRTGANAATRIRFGRDVTVGGVAVPAGEYSMWTIPARSGWTLILNRNAGQWGTEYDEAHDFARIPMQVKELTEPVERFTIAVEPAGTGGALRLAWDRTEASVPIARD